MSPLEFIVRESRAEPIAIVSATVLFVPIFITLPAFPVPRLIVLALFPFPIFKLPVVPESIVRSDVGAEFKVRAPAPVITAPEAPIFIAFAAPPIFNVVAFALNRLAVLVVVFKSPPLILTSPAVLIFEVPF